MLENISENLDVGIDGSSFLGEYFQGRSISQTFTCYQDNLNRIDLKFATYRRLNNSGILQVDILNHKEEVIRTSEIDISEIEDNSWHPVHFKTLKNSKDKKYTIRVLGEKCKVGSSVSSYFNPKESVFQNLKLGNHNFRGNLCLRVFCNSGYVEKVKLPIDQRIKFSILMPTYNTPVKFLKKTIKSVLDQTYTNWELCIVDDGSTDLETLSYLQNLNHPNIKIKFSKENNHISITTNQAFDISTGDYVCLLDHDDELNINALYYVNLELSKGSYDVVYSNENTVGEFGEVIRTAVKPSYNKNYLLSVNYICHFLVMKRDLFKTVGGMRAGYEGSQDHDLVLRLSEHTDKIRHIPRILYHWKAIQGSTALSGENKKYAWDNGLRAVKDAVSRRGLKARAVKGRYFGTYTLVPNLDEYPKVSVIIPFKDNLKLTTECIDSILTKTTYPNLEIIGLDNGSSKETSEHIDYRYNSVKNIKFYKIFTSEFNFSKLINFGISQTNSEYMIIMNNDTEVISKDWVEKLLMYSMQDNVAVVGSKLLYEDNTIQHAGVSLGYWGVAGHPYAGENRNYLGGSVRLDCAINVNCVTAACMMINKRSHKLIGPFNDRNLKVAFNDVDYCIRARNLGFDIVQNNTAELYHYESKSRGYDHMDPVKKKRFEEEALYMKKTYNLESYRDTLFW